MCHFVGVLGITETLASNSSCAVVLQSETSCAFTFNCEGSSIVAIIIVVIKNFY